MKSFGAAEAARPARAMDWATTEPAPADWPQMEMALGSPPKAAMYLFVPEELCEWGYLMCELKGYLMEVSLL